MSTDKRKNDPKEAKRILERLVTPFQPNEPREKQKMSPAKRTAGKGRARVGKSRR